MTQVSSTELHQNLSRYLDEVIDERTPLVVTLPGGKPNVVMISETEFDGMQETVHLLSNPANADRLRRGLYEADVGELIDREVPNDLPGA